MILGLLAGATMATSCSEKIADFEPQYDYVLSVAPTSNTITEGATIEIACELLRNHYYTADAEFTIYYEQVAGGGELTMQGQELTPNRTYRLPQGAFVMQYRAEGIDHHSIRLTVADEYSNTQQTTIRFTDITE